MASKYKEIAQKFKSKAKNIQSSIKQRKTDKANGIPSPRAVKRANRKNPPPRMAGENYQVLETLSTKGIQPIVSAPLQKELQDDQDGYAPSAKKSIDINKAFEVGQTLLTGASSIYNTVKGGKGGADTSTDEVNHNDVGAGGGGADAPKDKPSPMDLLKKYWYVPVAVVVLIIGGVVLAKRKK